MVEKTVLLFVIFGHSLKSPPFKTFDLLAEDFHVCFVFFQLWDRVSNRMGEKNVETKYYLLLF